MEEDLLHYYYQFHYEQHYFLCHDILEEAWKMQQSFSKGDAVVGLILLATGCYHYRRGNFKGAHKSFKKAYQISIKHPQKTWEILGLNSEIYFEMLLQLIQDAGQQKPFYPVCLPLTANMMNTIQHHYPHFEVTQNVVQTPFILHHHQLRDRSEVIAARMAAYEKRRQ
ncbi:DUF309 domain-containing protein [Staphylococcus lutrae]